MARCGVEIGGIRENIWRRRLAARHQWRQRRHKRCSERGTLRRRRIAKLTGYAAQWRRLP